MKHQHCRWKVCFGKNYWGTQKGTDQGEELHLDREFEWNGHRWLIPALYRCRQGLVVDFAIEVPQGELRAYMEKWGLTENGECTRTLTRAEERQMEQENPLDIGFCASLRLNGGCLHPSDGCGMGYLPGTDAGSDEGSGAGALLWAGRNEGLAVLAEQLPMGNKEPEEPSQTIPNVGTGIGSGTGAASGRTVPDTGCGGVGDNPRTGKRECRLSIDGAGCPVGNAGAPGLRRLGTSKLFLHDDVPSDAESGTLLPDRLRRGRPSAPQTTGSCRRNRRHLPENTGWNRRWKGMRPLAVIGGADGPTAPCSARCAEVPKKRREPLRQPPPAILPQCGRKRSHGRRNLTENPAGIPQFH